MQTVTDRVSHYALDVLDRKAARVDIDPFDVEGARADPVEEVAPPPATGSERLDAILKAAGVRFHTGGEHAATARSEDYADEYIQMPRRERFRSDRLYRHLIAHELGHWTETRVGRPPGGISGMDGIMFQVFGVAPPHYNREELVAELTAALILDVIGDFDDVEETRLGSYLSLYLSSFDAEDRPKVLEWATVEAHKAADYLLSLA